MSTNIYRNTAYSFGQGPLTTMYPTPIVANRAPTTADMAQIGQMWITTAAAPTSPSAIFILQAVVNNSANWIAIDAGTGTFTSLTVNGPTVLNGSLTQTAGNVSMGADAAAQTIAIGTGAAAKTVTIGSTNTTSTTTIAGGSGGILLDGAVAAPITIGDAAQTGTITLGSSTATNTQIIAGGTGATTLQIANAQTAGSVSIGAAMTTGTITIGGTGLQTGTITVGGGTGAQTVNLATGGTGVKTVHIADSAVANVVTLGSTTGAAQTTINAGTAGLSLVAGGAVAVTPATATVASPTATATINERVGVATFTGFTTANTGGAQAYTITNSTVTVTSATLVNVTNLNASTNGAFLTITGVVQAAGSLIVHTANNGAGALGAGDNVLVTFWILS